jgi:hypothetical protein
VIGAPPLSAGLVNATLMLRSPTALTDVMVGAAGAFGRTTTGDDGVEAGPVPTALVAVTLHVYVAFPVRLGTRIGDFVAS